ncbi:MAG: T9SS type A sorting domain-containing protein [Crocinitomix sp.]|nr:T9SS type A sorting domain-containing protein [Crocinitomix sp.]
MKSNALTLKSILLTTIVLLSMSSYGNVNAFFVSPELPALPQVSAEDDDDDDNTPGIDNAGTISETEILCGPSIPDIIKNVTEPSGEIEGFLVFQWGRKIYGEVWVVIPGANGLDYEPGLLSETTIYRRGCRESSSQPWIYSNPVTKKIVSKIEGAQLSATAVTCKDGNDGTVQVMVSGGTPDFTYNWIVSDETGCELTDIPAGFYNVEVTDQNGCTHTSEYIEVEEPEIGMVVSELVSYDPTCVGSANGAIYIFADDVMAPYEYNWSIGDVGPSVIGVPAGFYEVTVTDALGCEVTKSDLVLNEPDMIQLLNQAVAATCFDAADGSIIVNAIGGTAPYLYTWPDGEYGNVRGDLTAGTYDVNIVDYNGCFKTQEVTIIQPEELALTSFTVNNKICKASINVLPTGGTAPYTYEWEDGSVEGFKTGLCPGLYKVNVTDNHGCATTETMEIVKEVSEDNISIAVIVNPFHENGNIIIKLPFDDYADVRIYSSTGQLVEIFLHEEAEVNQEIRITLDIDKYSNGVYIVEVLSGGLTTSEKVIVSN